MGRCPLNLTFFTAGEHITFGEAVDRAIDDAAVFRILGLGPKGPGPGTQLAPRDPGAPPKYHGPLLPNLIFLTAGECITFGASSLTWKAGMCSNINS